jgi:hypothetical protein
MSSHDTRSLDDLLSAARDRQSPWDSARSERVLSRALTTRATRARNKARRFSVATACGAILLLGLGIRGLASGPSASASTSAAHADVTQESNESTPYGTESQPPSASELAALARNDGGYGRD